MRRLWVRLSLAFSLVIVAVALTMGTIGSLLQRDTTVGTALLQRFELPQLFISQLVSAYEEAGSWQNLRETLVLQDATLPRSPFGRLSLIVADASGSVIYDGDGNTVGDLITPAQRSASVQLTTSDATIIGYVRLQPVVSALGDAPSDTFFQEQFVRLLLVVGMVVATVSIVAGILVSRTLTAPLSRLAQTARSFGSRTLDVRAQIRGSAEIREVARAFNEMAGELQRAETQRRHLVADIAHELRTPLTVLKSNLQALVDGVYTFNVEEAQELLQQTDLLSHLVADLHDLSLAESQQLRLDLDLIDLPSFVQRRAQKFRTMVENHGLTLEVRVDPAAALVQGDANRLEQVMNNLVNNAITHTPAGGIITLSTDVTAQRASLTITDTGNGIPPEHLPHVFERFYRVDPARARATGGAGLGLAIVKAILDLHGATISATSAGEAGKGTTFTIHFPRISAAPPER